MSSWARPGVKCVCVDASFNGLVPDILVNGAVYTIRDVVAEPRCKSVTYADETLGFVLAEVANPYAPPHGGFAAARFRPLITRTQEQDVELFRHLLVNAPEPVSP